MFRMDSSGTNTNERKTTRIESPKKSCNLIALDRHDHCRRSDCHGRQSKWQSQWGRSIQIGDTASFVYNRIALRKIFRSKSTTRAAFQTTAKWHVIAGGKPNQLKFHGKSSRRPQLKYRSRLYRRSFEPAGRCSPRRTDNLANIRA